MTVRLIYTIPCYVRIEDTFSFYEKKMYELRPSKAHIVRICKFQSSPNQEILDLSLLGSLSKNFSSRIYLWKLSRASISLSSKTQRSAANITTGIITDQNTGVAANKHLKKICIKDSGLCDNCKVHLRCKCVETYECVETHLWNIYALFTCE